MRADRHEQQRLDFGPQHGPACRECVRGGTGRRGENNPVAAPPRQRPAVHLGDKVQHPLPGRLLDRRLVQRPGRRSHVTVRPDGDVDGHPLFNRVAPGHHAIDSVGKIFGLSLGQEAHMAQIHAEQRRARGPGQLRGTQQRAVPADDHHHLDAVSSRSGDRNLRHARTAEFGCLLHQDADLDPGSGQLPDDRVRAADAGRASGMRDQEHGPLRVHWGPSVMARCRAARSSGGADWRSHRKYSTFPDGPGNGLATTPGTPRPSSSAAAATPATADSRSAGSLTTPPVPTLPRPTSNWGLTSNTKSASGAAQATRAGSTSTSEMNDRSAVTRPGAGATCSGRSPRTLTRSRPVTRGAVRSGQASCPYPTSTATTCAAPRRRSTSVNPPAEAPASRHRRLVTCRPVKAASAPSSLWPPREAYSGAAPPPRTVMAASCPTCVAAFPARWPATATRPAAISSAACSRDRASPRRTSSASSRVLLLMDWLRPCSAAAAPLSGRPLTALDIAQRFAQLAVRPLKMRGML